MRMRRARFRSATQLLVALVVSSCNAPFPPDARLSLSVPSTTISVLVGGEQSMSVTVTRIGDYNGDVAIGVDGLPAGVTASIANTSTSGQTTTATITLRASAEARVGTFSLTIRGSVPRLIDATSLLVLTVSEPPTYTLALSTPTLTIARGGGAPITITLARTNFSAGVTLSVEGAVGISAAFAQNPSTGETTQATIAVGASVAPGTYTMTVRAVAAGLVDRTAPLTVTVIPDAIQLLAQSNVSGYQASTGTSSILVNRGTFAGAIALAAEGLPSGVTASFTPLTPTSASTTLTLVIGAAVIPGTYPVTVRASGAGVPDAATTFSLNVLATVFGLALSPQNVTLLQGTSATAILTIARTAIAVPVELTVEGAPAGLTITPSPASVAGTSSTINITAAPTLAAGQYTVTVRGTPQGLTVASSTTAALGVAVRTTAPGSGNVLLDWSACTAPSWVAAQDGAGSWTQLTGASGTFRFDVQSGKGSFAYTEGGNSIVVRYMTQAELTARAVDMCAGAPGTKTINGTAAHASITEQWVHRLGGGSATSTGAGRNFAMTGVRNGVHDFVAWGSTFGLGLRGLIRRDVDLADGASVGTINLAGSEAFIPVQRTLTISGGQGAENLSVGGSYLTTAACTVNELNSPVIGSFIYGVPDANQRPDDFHMVTANANTPTSFRSANEVSHTLNNRAVILPPPLAVPTMAALAGSYKRMQATLGTIPTEYSSSTLRVSDGARSMIVMATTGYTGTLSVALSTPDLSGVSGWPSALAIASGAHGSWTMTANGASSTASLCTAGMRTVLASQSGTF